MITKRKKSTARTVLERHAGGALTLGTLVRAIREGEGWSLADAARKLNVTRAFLGNIENGKPVSPEAAARYAGALGYAEEQFVRLALQDQMRRAGLKYEVAVRRVTVAHV
jgi:transcriptional regulator with XRE-family HTH domain